MLRMAGSGRPRRIPITEGGRLSAASSFIVLRSFAVQGSAALRMHSGSPIVRNICGTSLPPGAHPRYLKTSLSKSPTPALGRICEGRRPPGAVGLVEVRAGRDDLVDPVQGGVVQGEVGALQQAVQLV